MVKAMTNKWSVGEDEWVETNISFNETINIYDNDNVIIRRKHLQGNFSGEARCKVGFWNVGQEMYQRFNINIKMDNNVIFTKSSNTDAQTSRSYKYDIKDNEFTGKIKVYISSRGFEFYIDRNDNNLPKIPN